MIWFGFRRGRLMASEPLQQRLVFFCTRTLEVHLIHLVRGGLVRKWRAKEHGHFVCPDFDVGELEDHFRLQRCHGSQERVGSLVARNVVAVEAF